MLSRSYFPNFGQGPFPKIAGKSPGGKEKSTLSVSTSIDVQKTALSHFLIIHKQFGEKFLEMFPLHRYCKAKILSIKLSIFSFPSVLNIQVCFVCPKEPSH